MKTGADRSRRASWHRRHLPATRRWASGLAWHRGAEAPQSDLCACCFLL